MAGRIVYFFRIGGGHKNNGIVLNRKFDKYDDTYR